jgi:cytochrome c oxidase subunit 4
MSHSPEEVKKHIRIYIGVFIALAILTVVTVAVSYLHLPMAAAIGVALLIASFKATLVAGFFMHLFQEKPIIFWILILTFFFFLHLLIIPSLP